MILKNRQKLSFTNLFDTSTESSNMAMMNLFQQEQDEGLRSQESSRSQESQEKLRWESPSSNMISWEWYELKMMKLKLEMMRLEAQKLECQERLTERDLSIQLTSNESSASIY